MNIAIFGANGGTGRLLTSHSLDAGHTVTALVRNPAAFPFRDRVRIVQGSAFDPAAVASTVQGADAVFSALGAHSPFRNENVLPRAVPLIVLAMQQAGVWRIIALGSAGALPGALDKEPVWRRWIVQKIVYRYLLKWPIHEQIEQYRILSSSPLDWTMVLPPVLTNGAERGRYRIDGEALPPGGNSISRADVARFMFRQLDDPKWHRRAVYISN
jgi:putative NADH-flavin reductase